MTGAFSFFAGVGFALWPVALAGLAVLLGLIGYGLTSGK